MIARRVPTSALVAATTSRQCPDPTQSAAYCELLKLNRVYEQRQIRYDEFFKRSQDDWQSPNLCGTVSIVVCADGSWRLRSIK